MLWKYNWSLQTKLRTGLQVSMEGKSLTRMTKTPKYFLSRKTVNACSTAFHLCSVFKQPHISVKPKHHTGSSQSCCYCSDTLNMELILVLNLFFWVLFLFILLSGFFHWNCSHSSYSNNILPCQISGLVCTSAVHDS